jgi:hypothetical protein
LYTFGSPRTGNKAFSDFIFLKFSTQGYQRITHYNEFAPHLPPSILGFKHAGNEVWQKNAGNDPTIVECSNAPGLPENKGCANSMSGTGIDAHLNYFGVAIASLCT